MILRATFENIYSIKDETQISFVAGKSNAHPSHVSRAEKRDDISVLKAGIVYDANASGKSNVIKAIALLQQIANGSFPQSKVEPFKLADTEEKNSKVEIEFKTKGKCFAYGIEFTIGGIKEEWLFEINSRTDKEVFTRKITAAGNEFTFGKVDGNEETSMLLKYIDIAMKLLLQYGKKNPDVVDFLNKNMMIAEDEESGFRVVISFKKDEE